MVINTLNYSRKEIVVDYDKDKVLLEQMIKSEQVRPLKKNVHNISYEPQDSIKIGPTFIFKSKNELTLEDTLKIAKGYVHRGANLYMLNVYGTTATLKSFANPENIKMIELKDNEVAIYA